MFSGSDPILIDVEALDDSQTSNSYSTAIVKWSAVAEHKTHRNALSPAAGLPNQVRARPCQRLLVIVPNADLHEARLAQRINTMATYNHATVLLLSVCSSWADEPSARLRMALLAALVEGADTPTQTEIFLNDDWPTVLQRLYVPGDLLVCFPEHILPSGMADKFGPSHSMAHMLQIMHLPACELLGYVIALEQDNNWRKTLKVWLLPLGIALGMFIFQVFLVQWAKGWNDLARKTLMSITVIIELVSIACMPTA